MKRPTTPEEIDRLLDQAVAVTDAQGRLLGSRDLTPAERRAPAVNIRVVALDHLAFQTPPWHGCE